jgi:hypothetical protein
MSIELVRAELRRFLSTGAAEVICLRGKWGVGKTYVWNDELQTAQTKGSIRLERTSYVSLFGLNSLDEVKATIFENTLILRNGNLKADIGTLEAFVNEKIGSWRKISRYIQNVPFIKSVIGGETGQALSFLAVREQIICFDDLERLGEKLKIGDVLGLCSFLREQRDCKIVLLLNDEQLKTENAAFERYLEKIVDVSLTYEPTPLECSNIAKSWRTPVSERCSELSQKLGVTNLRVIRKIDHALELVRPIIATLDAEVFYRTSASLALFVWSFYQPTDSPSIEFLTNKKSKYFYDLEDQTKLSEQEKIWNVMLECYGYVWTDSFDEELIKGVKRGYFDTEKILSYAQEMERQIVASRADDSFSNAWRAFHDSFDDNQDVVLDGIYASFIKNVNQISPTGLDSTVRLFKDMKRRSQAGNMIAIYIKERANDEKLFDSSEFFLDEVKDYDVKEAFKAKYAADKKPVNLREVLITLRDGWSEETLSLAASATVDDYRKTFKDERGEPLRRIIAGALQFERASNITPNKEKIVELAKDALCLIAQESPINARRVIKYGFPAPTEQSNPAENEPSPHPVIPAKAGT